MPRSVVSTSGSSGTEVFWTRRTAGYLIFDSL